MKVFLAFALFIVGINAWPQNKGVNVFNNKEIGSNIDLRNERLISDTIAGVIQDVSQSIKDANLDPLYIENYTTGYALPVPIIFNAQLAIQELHSNGLSEIVINSMSFSIFTYRLRFDIELPRIEAALGRGEIAVRSFYAELTASASGSLAIVRPRVVGDVRVSVGIISGISLRSIDLDLNLGAIESNLSVIIQGIDFSNFINTFLGTTIPKILVDFSAEINELLEIIATDLINANL